jgi:colanic acid/amylovoran biosynthesis glycosyltransferase
MKITYIVNLFPKLSETFVLNQITGLIDMGHEVEIIAAGRPAEQIVQASVNKYNLLQKTVYLTRNSSRLGFELNERLVSALFFTDVIHAHFAAMPTDLALKMSKAFGIPFVFTAHAYDIFISPDANRLREKIDNALKLITISDFNKNYLLDMLGDDLNEKIEVIRCGVRLEDFKFVEREPKETVRVLSVGRFMEKKGFCYAVEAFGEVVKEFPNVELRIVGDGELKGEIVTLRGVLGLQDRIVLLGPQPQSVVRKEMEEADIFLLPSVTALNGDREGVPVVLMEAAATGLPIVSTIHSGIPEFVTNGMTGYLVPEKDVHALAEKLKELIEQPGLRKKMGKEGRKQVEANYSHKKEVDRLEDLFASLVMEKASITALAKEQRYLLEKRVKDTTVQLLEYRCDHLKRMDELMKRMDDLMKMMGNSKNKDEQINQCKDQLRQKEEQITRFKDQVRQRDEQIRQKEEQITRFKDQVRQRDEQIRQKEEQITRFKDQVRQRDEQIQSLYNSRCWKITAPLRCISGFIRKPYETTGRLVCHNVQNVQPVSIARSNSDSNSINKPSNNKFKVLYVLNSFPKLSETFVLNEIVELLKMGIEVRILARFNPGEKIVNANILRYQLLERVHFLQGEPQITLESESILKEYSDINIVHSHFAAEAAEIGAQVALILKKSFTFTAHAYEIFDVSFLDVEKLKYLMNAASVVITPSEYNKKYLMNVTGFYQDDRIKIVRATIDIEKFPPRLSSDSTRGLNIITIGRLVKKKGTIYLIKSMKIVLEQFPDAHLFIVGDGPERVALDDCIRRWKLERNISILGEMTNEKCDSLMDKCDIAVLPCIVSDSGDRDVCPLTLQEAMAKEIPVISTFVASIPELIEDGVSGLLVPEKDEKALADALMKLMDNPKLREVLGKNGRNRILDEFNIKTQVTKLVNIWKLIISDIVVSNNTNVINPVWPPKEKQFRNRFFQNDYSEIEERVETWGGNTNLKASIIVSSYNQKETLKLNLLAWEHQKYPKKFFEVIVADDGSSDGTKEMIEGLISKVTYKLKFYTQEDLGFRLAKVRNEGVALSEGDVLCFVDADTIPSPEYILEHMKYYHVSDSIAVVGFRHRIEGEFDEANVSSLQAIEALRELPMVEDKGVSEKVRNWRKNVLFNNSVFRKQNSVWGGFHGTLVSCRKMDYIGVGGSDEKFKAYGQEDTELAFRLLAKVRYLVSNPRARIYHIEHPYNDAMSNPVNIKMLEEKTRCPLITVYIYAYNAEQSIEDSIQSVFLQTHQDFELIIVEAGSKGGTREILEKYRYHPKVRLLSQAYKGKAEACNVAVLYARGKYICPLEGGDLLLPNALEAMSSVLEIEPSVGLVYGAHYEERDGKEIPVQSLPYNAQLFLSGQNELFSMMWRKSCFGQTVGFDPDLESCIYQDIALKLEEIAKVKHIAQYLYRHRGYGVDGKQNAEIINVLSQAQARRS